MRCTRSDYSFSEQTQVEYGFGFNPILNAKRQLFLIICLIPALLSFSNSFSSKSEYKDAHRIQKQVSNVSKQSLESVLQTIPANSNKPIAAYLVLYAITSSLSKILILRMKQRAAMSINSILIVVACTLMGFTWCQF